MLLGMPTRPFRRGQQRPPHSGRRKGSKNKVPTSLKAVVDAYGTEPAQIWLFARALARGVLARPPHSAPYLKLVANRILGPEPKEPFDPTRLPLFIVLARELGSYDPLAMRAAPPAPPIVVEALRLETQRALAAPAVAPTPPPPEDPGLADLTLV